MQSVNSLYVLIAIAVIYLILATVQSIYILRRKTALTRLADKQIADDSKQPGPVSIIVFANGSNSALLDKSIPAIMEQRYPKFEVIVVNSDSSASTDDILTRLSCKYPELRSTFIPETSCNVSIRKLSATLGIKAATYDSVLLTDADCIPQSDEWLNDMSRHFDDETGIVIGYCRNNYGQDSAAGHRYRVFDTLMTDSQYLASAIRGHAFRGDRRNMAYRKQLFFDNKGFSRTMNLKFGDDDIFIKEISSKTNVAVELSHNSILSAQYDNVKDFYTSDKIHRMFTVGKISPQTIKTSSAMTIIRWLFLLLFLSLLCHAGHLFFQNSEKWLIPGIICAYTIIIYLAETLIFIFSMRKTAQILQAPKLFLTIPIFRFMRPFINFRFRTKSSHYDNFTWE